MADREDDQQQEAAAAGGEATPPSGGSEVPAAEPTATPGPPDDAPDAAPAARDSVTAGAPDDGNAPASQPAPNDGESVPASDSAVRDSEKADGAAAPGEGAADEAGGGEAAATDSGAAVDDVSAGEGVTEPARSIVQDGDAAVPQASSPQSSGPNGVSATSVAEAGGTASTAAKEAGSIAGPIAPTGSTSSESTRKTLDGLTSKSGSQAIVGKPPTGTSVTSKASITHNAKKSGSSARGGDGSGTPSSGNVPATGSQEGASMRSSEASAKETAASDSQQISSKPGSKTSVRKTASLGKAGKSESSSGTKKFGSQEEVKPTGSNVSAKKPPTGAGSRAILKKSSSKVEGPESTKASSKASVKKTRSNITASGEDGSTSDGGKQPGSAPSETVESLVTLSGSKTSRRSRASVRQIPAEEVWVPPEYDSEEFRSGAFLSEMCALNEDTLVFLHSFGYDCLKPDNLCMLDSTTAMFVSGNMIHFLNTETKAIVYMRSSTGGGIGHATVHPSYKYLAVAEKGVKPNVLLYRWPELTVYRVLRGGTEREFTYVAFSSNGELLCSQGGEPDYMLTVWNWETEKTLLRCKAFSQDVYKVTFSPFHPGQLTSAGLGHLKFWKMAQTFTGLKLQGRLGRFGKTEISDINGFLQLPDGKVVSGCEWGNILVWDDALIKVEITRRDGKPCHNGVIHKFYLEEGELITLGSDGWVRTWDFDTVDQAEAPDEAAGKFALDPMNELYFSAHSSLYSMWPHPDATQESIWFMQDACGGIWRADLSFAMTTKGPEQLYECSAGPIRDMVTCPTGTLMVATGDDGNVSFYNYRTRDVLARTRYPAGGNSIIWLTQEICQKTCAILVGFADGCLRLLELSSGVKKGSSCISLMYVQKPHTEPITIIKQSPSGRMLVTASEDGTVWFFSLLMEEAKFVVAPLGFAEYGERGESVNCLEFLPGSERKFLLFTSRGRVVEMRTPGVKDLTDHTTYGIKGIRGRSWLFRSVKSEILREEAFNAREVEKAKQRQELQDDINQRKEVGLEVEEEIEKAKLEKLLLAEDRDTPEIPLVVPDPPSAVLVGVPAPDGTFRLLMDGWDAGWLLTGSFHEARPSAVRVPDVGDVGVSVRRRSPDGRYLVLGLCDGRIRIHTIQEGHPWSLNDYWAISMHDNTYGRVTGVQFTYDQRNLITSGADGNIFLFDFNPPDGQARPRSSKIILLPPPEERMDDIDDRLAYSLEQQRQRSAEDARRQLADQRKAAVKVDLADLRRDFKQWVVLNQGLPAEVSLSRDDMLLDERIRAEQRRRAEENLCTARKEMEWEADRCRLGRQKLHDRFKGDVQYDRVVLRSFRGQHEVQTFRVKIPSSSFLETRDRSFSAVSVFHLEMLSRAPSGEMPTRSKAVMTADPDGNRFEQMSPEARRQTRKSVGARAFRALLRLEEKKTKRRRRRTQWTNMRARRPDGKTDDLDDLAAIQLAVDSLGDFKLKTAEDFKVVDSQQNTTHLKRHQLISAKEQVFNHKNDFNEKVLKLRRHKKDVLHKLNCALVKAVDLQKQLPPSLHVKLPEPQRLADDEAPEHFYEITEEALAEYRSVAAAAAAIAHEDPAVVTTTTTAAAAAGATAAASADQTTTESTAATGTPHSTLRRRSMLRHRHQTAGLESIVHRAKPAPQRSDTDQKLAKVKEMRTLFARDQELRLLNDLIETFDKQVYELWQEMVYVEYQLKNADLRVITRFQELMLVREFEKREAELNRILQEKLQEDTECQMALAEVSRRFEARAGEQAELEQQLQDLLKEVTAGLPGDKYNKFLTRVYKKKVKRKVESKKDGDDDDDDSGSSSSLSDSDDDDDEDEDEDDEDAIPDTWDPNACPPGGDQQLFDWVSQKRLERGELEFELSDKRLAFEVTKKEFDSVQKKAKAATAALEETRNGINAFQLQKLARLNELEVAVALHLSQLQLLEDGHVPADLSLALVFWNSELERLAVRIDQLYTETAQEKQHRRASYREERRLKQDCRLMEKYIVKLDKQAVAEMKKKFGRLVVLEDLESLSVNETQEELRIRLESEQCTMDEDSMERKKLISETRTELIAVIRANTDKVGVIQMLEDEKRHLDKGLNFIRKAGIAPHDKRLDDALEIEHLMNTISSQKTQIMELKNEIWMLSLKSKPWNDPCASLHQQRPHEQASGDDLDFMGLQFMGSQCSEDFLVSMGIVPEQKPGSGTSGDVAVALPPTPPAVTVASCVDVDQQPSGCGRSDCRRHSSVAPDAADGRRRSVGTPSYEAVCSFDGLAPALVELPGDELLCPSAAPIGSGRSGGAPAPYERRASWNVSAEAELPPEVEPLPEEESSEVLLSPVEERKFTPRWVSGMPNSVAMRDTD